MSQTRPERAVRAQSALAGVTRVGLRVAVAAGVAGAAWALSASAANAAESPAPTATDLSLQPLTTSVVTLISGVGDSAAAVLDATTGHPSTADRTAGTVPAAKVASTKAADTSWVLAPVDGVLTSAAEPLLGGTSHILSEVLAPTNTVLHGSTGRSVSLPEAPAHRHAAGSGHGAATTQVAAPTPGGGDAAARTDAAYVPSDDLVRTVTDIVAPLGLGDLVQAPLRALQPMIGIADPVLAPLAVVLQPVTATLRMVVVPVTTVVGTVTRPVTMTVLRSTAGLFAYVTGTVAPTRAPVLASLTPSHEAMRAVDAATIAMTPVRVEAGTSAQRAYDRAVTRGTPEASQGGRHVPSAPVLPVSAPGAVPTTTSGSHLDGGGDAILSTPVVNGSVASHQLLTATGVEVRPLLVEIPTVSPD